MAQMVVAVQELTGIAAMKCGGALVLLKGKTLDYRRGTKCSYEMWCLIIGKRAQWGKADIKVPG